MILNILTWLLLVAATVFFSWLVTRAWKSRRWFTRWPGVVLSGLLALILALVSVVGAIGLVNVYMPTGSPVQSIQVNATPQQIARGAHIANVLCANCHAPDSQALSGGYDMAKDIPIPMGSLVSPNLTTGGPLKNWSDGEIIRALREGVDRNGQRLMTMRNLNIRYMSDEDLLSLIAFLRSQPAVDHPTQNPPDRLNLLGVMVFGSGIVPDLPPVTSSISAPPKAATVDYGQYLLSYQDCRSCHGADLNGGTSKVSPNGPPLRVVKGWSQEQFSQTMRTGVTPDGHLLQPPMPWKIIARMDDMELQAIYKYLVNLP